MTSMEDGMAVGIRQKNKEKRIGLRINWQLIAVDIAFLLTLKFVVLHSQCTKLAVA
jgi:hypothetical protein